jgi:hypothetical protein
MGRDPLEIGAKLRMRVIGRAGVDLGHHQLRVARPGVCLGVGVKRTKREGPKSERQRGEQSGPLHSS